jgi:hypothetical protein
MVLVIVQSLGIILEFNAATVVNVSCFLTAFDFFLKPTIDGHTVVRCKKEVESTNDGGFDGAGAGTSNDNGGWESTANGNGGWNGNEGTANTGDLDASGW